jgi:hypothetical protein
MKILEKIAVISLILCGSDLSGKWSIQKYRKNSYALAKSLRYVLSDSKVLIIDWSCDHKGCVYLTRCHPNKISAGLAKSDDK